MTIQPSCDGESASSCTDSTATNSIEDVQVQGVPHKKSVVAKAPVGIFRNGGTVPTAVCLSKAAIGAGVLSMAVHSAEVGLLYQFCCLSAGAALTLVSIQLIARASIETQCWSYEDLCEELFNPAMSLLTGFINVCNCLGSGAGYLIVCGQVFQVATGASEEMRQIFIVAAGVCVCAPLALAKDVSYMRHLAAASVFALLLVVGTVAWYLGKHGQDETVTSHTLVFGPGGATVFAYMNSINNIVFAYNNQFNVPQLTGELTPQPTLRRMSSSASITVILCFLLFASVSVVGTLAFGVGEAQRDSLVLDLAPERQHPLVMISLLAVMFSVLTCFQFHIYPIRQFGAWSARKARGRGRDSEGDDAVYCGVSLTRWLDIGVALGSVVVIILIAVVVSSLKTILDFIGAFAAAYISYIVPPLWIIQIRRRQKGFTWMSVDVLGCLALFSLGQFFFVFGTYSAVIDLFAQ